MCPNVPKRGWHSTVLRPFTYLSNFCPVGDIRQSEIHSSSLRHCARGVLHMHTHPHPHPRCGAAGGLIAAKTKYTKYKGG